MINRRLILTVILACAFPSLAAPNKVDISLFSWAKSGLETTFPQTYVLDKNKGVTYGRLGFVSEADFVQSWQNKEVNGSLDIKKIKDNFPTLNTKLQTAWRQNEKVVVTVGLNGKVADCTSCTEQSKVLKKKDYFGLPHLEVTLSK